MKYIAPLILILALAAIAHLGTGVLHLETVFGVVIPYAAFLTFILGFIYRVYTWASAPVPYRVPTTAGQARSLDWMRRDRFESPANFWEAAGRMAIEVLFFRSLFRNTRAELKPGPNLAYLSSKWLWLGAIVFHWAMLIVVLRHYRFFLEPIPGFVLWLDAIDGILEITLPTFYITDLLLAVSLVYLLLRRYVDAATRYLSLPNDYFPLYLIGGIVLTGVLMRYGVKADVYRIKTLVQSLVRFQPITPSGISPLFYTHLFLVCVLGAYFPFSKLMHAGGVFLSPTRNLANNSREVRHVNPHNPVVDTGSYAQYEEEFKDKMVQSGIPLDQA